MGSHGCWIAKKLAQHNPSSGVSANNLAQHATRRRFWAIFRALGELFRAHTHHQTTQGELFRARDPAHGDFETNDTSAATDAGQHETTITTARPQQGTTETDDTSAPEKCAKNTHFAPAKAMAVSTPHGYQRAKATAVSVTARPAPAKATAVSTPHRHNRAKATAVSDKRAAWSAEPDHSARGRRQGLAGRPVGGQCYKRRQTNAIHIASRGPLLQTSSICVQKP